MDKKKAVLIIIGIWILIITVWVIRCEYTIKMGQKVFLKTVPVDPRDLFMGDYVILNYEIGQFPYDLNVKYKKNQNVYVTLYVDKNNIAHIQNITENKPTGNTLFLNGTLGNCNTIIPLFNNGKCINYGIESYYVKEKAGKALEKQLQNGALVKVSIDKNGKAKVIDFKK